MSSSVGGETGRSRSVGRVCATFVGVAGLVPTNDSLDAAVVGFVASNTAESLVLMSGWTSSARFRSAARISANDADWCTPRAS